MRALLLTALLVLAAADLTAQGARPLAFRIAPGGATLDVGSVLGDSELEGAARSGLPIRVHARVELWRDEFADDLVESRAWTTVLAYEPLTRRFFVRSTAGTQQSLVFSTFAAARAAIEREYPLRTAVRREGRYYYRARVEIQTLSTSDLKELERWLQGDLQPAVEGDQSLPGALGEGAKRLLIRVLGVPNRSYEARSDRFRIGS